MEKKELPAQPPSLERAEGHAAAGDLRCAPPPRERPSRTGRAHRATRVWCYTAVVDTSEVRTHLRRWHALFEPEGIAGLNDLLDDDVVLHSPVVHRPLEGTAITYMYLVAASKTLVTPEFRYVRELVDAPHAVLEFETLIDGIFVNGVDMITWNDAGRIIDFKVMVRPVKAVEKVRQIMADMLDAMK